jgi:hypothetical protein
MRLSAFSALRRDLEHLPFTSFGLKQYLNDYADVLVFEMQVLCGIFVHLLKVPKRVEPFLRLRSEGGMVLSIFAGPMGTCSMSSTYLLFSLNRKSVKKSNQVGLSKKYLQHNN